MVALQGIVVPSTTVLSAVCRGGTRLWGEPPHSLQAHIDKSVWVCYSFFVYAYSERERGLGGSTKGMRQAVGARLRRRPGLMPRALAQRAETRVATLCLHARAE